MAKMQGMLFAPQLALFDLGFVTRRAYERASPVAGDLLKTVLSLPHRTGTDLHTMAVQAKLILGGFFLTNAILGELTGGKLFELHFAAWTGWGRIPGAPFLEEQAWGAWMAFAGLAVWSARRHLRAVWRTVWGLSGGVDDSREPASYRFAFDGAVLGLMYLTLFWVAGDRSRSISRHTR